MELQRCCCRLMKNKLLISSALIVAMVTYVFLSVGVTESIYTANRSSRLISLLMPSDQQLRTSNPQPSKTVLKAENTNSKLPLSFLHKPIIKRQFNKTCAKFPNLFGIKIHNNIWQYVRLKNGEDLYLFSAHFDNRDIILQNQDNNKSSVPIVRLLGLTSQSYIVPLKGWCQFWYENKSQPIFSAEANFTYMWNFKWGYSPKTHVPLLISCPLTPQMEPRSPDVVSFVENQCDNPTNTLIVQHAPETDLKIPPKNSVAVCISALAYWSADRSYQLMEWLELLKLLGADKVYIYELTLHPNMKKVLQYYVDTGFVDHQIYNLAGNQVNNPELITLLLRAKTVQTHYNKVLPYNDCLYRNWYKHEYLVIMDTDEIILPADPKIFTWSQLLSQLLQEKLEARNSTGSNSVLSNFPYSSLCAKNVHFINNATDLAKAHLPTDIPSYLYMLNHVTRAAEFEPVGSGTKCFQATARVFTLHNHLPFKCVGKCKAHFISPTVAHMQHYRSDCSLTATSRCRVGKVSNATILDTTVWKYKDDLIENCNGALQQMNLLPNNGV